MKKLLSLALMLVGLTAFGQSHKNNTFTTNPYPTTISFPSFNSGTIVMSGFSVAAVNGNYVFAAGRWTKAANGYYIEAVVEDTFAYLKDNTDTLLAFASLGEPSSYAYGYAFFPNFWEDAGVGGTIGVGAWESTTRSATLAAPTNSIEFFQVRTLLASNLNVGVLNVLTNLSPLQGAGGNMFGSSVFGYGNRIYSDQAFIGGGNENAIFQRQGFIGGGNTSILMPKSTAGGPGTADSAIIGSEICYMDSDASGIVGALNTTNFAYRNTFIGGSWKSTLFGDTATGFGSAMVGSYESFALLHQGSFVGGRFSTNMANGHSVFSFGEGNRLSNVNHIKVLGDYNQATIADNHGGWALGNGHRIDKVARGYLGNTNSVFIDPDGSITLYSITNRGALGTLGHEWITTNNVPNEPAADGSIATASSGANTGGALYQRVNGAWVPITNYFSMVSGGGPSSTDMIEPLAVNGTSAFLGVTGTKNLYISTGTGAIELNRNGVARINIGAITAISGDLSLGSAGSAISVSGISTIGAVNLGTTPTPYMILNNQTAAAAGAQQVSPGLVLSGNGWKTTATAASQPVDFRIYNLPVQGSAAPSGALVVQSQINGGGYTDRLQVTSGGLLNVGPGAGIVAHGVGGGYAGSVPGAGNIYCSDGSSIVKAGLLQSGDGQLLFALAGDIRWATSTDALGSRVTGLSSPSAGIVSADTTAEGNGAGRVKATGYYEGYFATETGFTLTVTNGVVNVTADSQTITLPTAVGITGRKYTLKYGGGSGSLTLATTSSQTIDGAAPGTMTTMQSKTFISDGANWWIIAN